MTTKPTWGEELALNWEKITTNESTLKSFILKLIIEAKEEERTAILYFVLKHNNTVGPAFLKDINDYLSTLTKE